MNKWLGLVIVLLVIWIAKLNWDVYQLNTQKISMLTLELDQQSQRMGRLNDQLVVLNQKQQAVTVSPNSHVQTVSPNTNETTVHSYDIKSYFVDKIQLTQLALDQQQFNLALQYIQEMRQQLSEPQEWFSESLKDALLVALVHDQANVVNYLQQRSEHLQLLQQQLTQLNTLLVPTQLDDEKNKWDFSTWFNLKKVSVTPDLAQRNIQYQKLQLQVLLAKQALLAGQTDFYRQQVSDILLQVKQYPDLSAQQSVKQLQKIEQLNLNSLPQMSASALMREN